MQGAMGRRLASKREFNFPSLPEQAVIRNSTIRAEGAGQTRGLRSSISKIRVQNSQIYAATSTVSSFGVIGDIKASHSFLSGGSAAGTVKCAAVTDESYDFFTSTCP